jgi:hypothetical protein
MEINLNIPFCDLDGSPVSGEKTTTQGKLLAQVLANHTKGNAIKLLEWAMLLHQGKPLTLDTSDFETLKEIVTGTDVLPAMSKGQILLSLRAS